MIYNSISSLNPSLILNWLLIVGSFLAETELQQLCWPGLGQGGCHVQERVSWCARTVRCKVWWWHNHSDVMLMTWWWQVQSVQPPAQPRHRVPADLAALPGGRRHAGGRLRHPLLERGPRRQDGRRPRGGGLQIFLATIEIFSEHSNNCRDWGTCWCQRLWTWCLMRITEPWWWWGERCTYRSHSMTRSRWVHTTD